MWKKLALVLCSVLLALIVAEGLVRVLGAAPKVYVIRKGRFQLSHNPRIGYEPVPMVYNGKDLGFYDYLGASNSLGFRDREHALAKPPGTYRIVVLGDSVAAGLKVKSSEAIFPVVLEKMLIERGLHAEVLNFAVSGYNTQQEVETLRDKALPFHPDLVVLAYTMSSRERLDGDILKSLLEAERRQDGINSARAHPWLAKSALYRLVRYRVLAPRAAQPGPEMQRYLDLVASDNVVRYFGVLHDLAQEDRFEVVVAIFPRFVRTFRAYPFGDEHLRIARLAQQNGFKYVDMLAPYSDCRDRSDVPISNDHFHPSAYGHRCAAEILTSVILSMKPQPQGP